MDENVIAEPTGLQSGPLAGVRVLEFCHFLAGPYAGMVLADLGADVIKIEDPRHLDEARGMGPYFQGDQSLYFASLNSGKRSIAIDLSSAEGRDTVMALVATADVVLDNYRPNVLRKLSLGYDVLRAANPRLVTCSITGFGLNGPDADRAGYDYTIQAITGVMSMGGEPDGPPSKAGVSYVDHSGGLAAAFGVCAALVERSTTGTGRHVDASLFDVQTSMLTYLASWSLNAGATVERMPYSSHPSLVPAQNFRTADGWVALFVGNDGMWKRFVEVMGLPELAEPELATMGGRREQRDRVLGLIQAELLTRPTAHWVQRMDAAGVAIGPVNDLAGALAEPQVAARRLIAEKQHPAYGRYEHVRGPLPMMSPGPTRPCPLPGEHTAEILAELGR